MFSHSFGGQMGSDRLAVLATDPKRSDISAELIAALGERVGTGEAGSGGVVEGTVAAEGEREFKSSQALQVGEAWGIQ
ncbi:hypothetical protein [Singulisphaera sp. GP187]|uniref:hypothetical protein n=1 Tax=Singulisphaera sp. GP187 TaxID=1882752 RepID=UPI0009409C32|nr:hypothetical protein [Singulisphaera sp. GP187]